MRGVIYTRKRPQSCMRGETPPLAPRMDSGVGGRDGGPATGTLVRLFPGGRNQDDPRFTGCAPMGRSDGPGRHTPDDISTWGVICSLTEGPGANREHPRCDWER